jgi:hypothetical protein
LVPSPAARAPSLRSHRLLDDIFLVPSADIPARTKPDRQHDHPQDGATRSSTTLLLAHVLTPSRDHKLAPYDRARSTATRTAVGRSDLAPPSSVRARRLDVILSPWTAARASGSQQGALSAPHPCGTERHVNADLVPLPTQPAGTQWPTRR